MIKNNMLRSLAFALGIGLSIFAAYSEAFSQSVSGEREKKQAVSGVKNTAEVLLAAQNTIETSLGKKFALPRNDIEGLLNFAKISDELYRGQQPERKGFEALKKMGIKTIVSLRAFHSDRPLLKGLGLNYYRISFNTWHAEDEDVLKFLKIIKNPKYHPVFVHCQHGADRTGTMCAIYRIIAQGWSVEDAISEMKNFGFHEVWANLPVYLRALDADKLLKDLKTAADPVVDKVM